MIEQLSTLLNKLTAEHGHIQIRCFSDGSGYIEAIALNGDDTKGIEFWHSTQERDETFKKLLT